MLVYLIGNRVDEEDKRQVDREQAVEYCKANNIDKFFETSAKSGENVEKVFSLAAKELHKAKIEAAKNNATNNPYSKKKAGSGSITNPAGSKSAASSSMTIGGGSGGLSTPANQVSLQSVQVMKTEDDKKCCIK